VSTAGARDQYVAVTCRMAGGGARVPLSLTDVRLAFEVETPVLFIAAGTVPPPVSAEITYTGTGRLVGRWEIVQPGDELPETRDRLTEATLAPDERGTQRRYAQVERFNVFLPPTGTYTLRGPEASRLPTRLEGSYQVLLRIEASDDKEGDSNLGAAGAGTGVVHSGAVAGFAIPALRYVVGTGGSELSAARTPNAIRLLVPQENAGLEADHAVDFAWSDVARAALYELQRPVTARPYSTRCWRAARCATARRRGSPSARAGSRYGGGWLPWAPAGRSSCEARGDGSDREPPNALLPASASSTLSAWGRASR
jgi:hypothetical protein